MKQPVLLVLFSISLIGFYGCRKTEIIERAIMPNRTFIYTVTNQAWYEGENPLHVQTDINIPELTQYYLLEGQVSVAMSTDNEGSYDILPSTFNGYAYSVNYSVGRITIYIEDPINEGNLEVPFPEGTLVFKVVLSDSEFIP